VTIESACRAVAKFADLNEQAEMQFPGVPERVRMQEIVRALVDWLVSGLIQGTADAARGLADVDAVRRHPWRVAAFTAETAEGARQLRQYLREAVYQSPQVQAARAESAAKVPRLFEYLLRHPEEMPQAYREESARQPLHRQVCDYIAGMTDGFFLKTCARLPGL